VYICGCKRCVVCRSSEELGFRARNNRVTVRDLVLVMWLGSVLAAACRLLSADSSVAPMR